jgi:hypothetical protein
MDSIEVFKDVKGYEGLYQVSNFGRVKSCERMVNHYKGNRIVREKILIQIIHKGYNIVNLAKSNSIKTYRVHRLVAETFIDRDDFTLEVNHINGQKNDNRLINLEWCSRSYNQKHAYDNGLQKPYNKRGILMIDKNGKIVNQFDSITEAESVTNLCHSNISKVCNGKRNFVGGFNFKYVN